MIKANEIKKKEPMTIWIQSNDRFESPHLLRADRIELMGHEIYFYLGKELIFKVWLNKEYTLLKEAMKDAGIKIA